MQKKCYNLNSMNKCNAKYKAIIIIQQQQKIPANLPFVL